MSERPVGEPAEGPDRLIDPGLLRLLLLIADTGRFGAAADALGVSQPSVSQQIKRIEQYIGRPLFRRARRGVDLTPEGQAVIRYARAVLGLAGDLRQRLDALRGGAEVAAGMSEDFCRTGLPAVLRLFILAHPHIRVRIVTGTYETLTSAIEARAVDFAFMRRYDRFPEAEPFCRQEMDWYGGRGLRSPVEDPVPLVVPLPPNPTRTTTIEVLRAAGRRSVVRFESIGIAGIEMAIAADLGVCAGPRGMSLVVAAPLREGHGLPPLPPVEFVMVQTGAPLSDAAAAFSKILMEAARLGVAADDAPTGAERLVQRDGRAPGPPG